MIPCLTPQGKMMLRSREKVWSLGITALHWRKSLQSHLGYPKLSSKIISTKTSFTTATRCYRFCKNCRVQLSFYYLQCKYISKLSNDPKHRCWNCNKSKSTSVGPFLSCPFCKAVQPVDTSVDYFVIFGMWVMQMFHGFNLFYQTWNGQFYLKKISFLNFMQREGV